MARACDVRDRAARGGRPDAGPRRPARSPGRSPAAGRTGRGAGRAPLGWLDPQSSRRCRGRAVGAASLVRALRLWSVEPLDDVHAALAPCDACSAQLAHEPAASRRRAFMKRTLLVAVVLMLPGSPAHLLPVPAPPTFRALHAFPTLPLT